MDLKEIRKEIDAADAQIAELLAKRMELAAKVAAFKMENGMPVLDTGREAEVIDSACSIAGEPYASYIAEIYQTIMKTSKDYQNVLLGREND